MGNEELIDILRDACRLCGACAAQLTVSDAVLARWPDIDDGGLVEIASTPFQTPVGASARIHLFAAQARMLSPIQAIVLAAYAEHASVTIE